MWRLGALALSIAVFFFVVVSGPMACGPSGSAGMQCANPAGYTENGSILTSSEGSGCGTSLMGTVAPGGACTGGGNCQPACCSCGMYASDMSVEVAYCNAGTCADPTTTCCAFISSMATQDASARACQ
jgi:hypothetical protein